MQIGFSQKKHDAACLSFPWISKLGLLFDTYRNITVWNVWGLHRSTCQCRFQCAIHVSFYFIIVCINPVTLAVYLQVTTNLAIFLRLFLCNDNLLFWFVIFLCSHCYVKSVSVDEMMSIFRSSIVKQTRHDVEKLVLV